MSGAEELTDENRFRRPTESAREQYVSAVEKYERRLSRINNEIDEHIAILDSGGSDENELRRIRSLLDISVSEYLSASDEYMNYLDRTFTEESLRELANHTIIRQSVVDKSERVLGSHKAVDDKNPTDFDNISTGKVSHKSKASKISASPSSRSSVLLRQKAKVEVARKRAEFLRQESELMQEKAQYEAETVIKRAQLEIKEKELQVSRECAVADAELRVLEEVTLGSAADQHSDVGSSIRRERTGCFIQEQNDFMRQETTPRVTEHVSAQVYRRKYSAETTAANNHEYNVPLPVNDNMSEYRSHHHGDSYEVEIGKYFARKEMLAQRLKAFDDRPENYISWKETFKCVVSELGASPSEELDLLQKWAGRDSSKQVNSIKISNAGNPTVGLDRAWQRLDHRYGSPEKVEFALKSKLSNVARITHKDKEKMYELSDILSEICAVKEKPEYSGILSYFDTASGVNPIITKLPTNIQGKWRDRAIGYKRSRDVLFPPFSFFCDFIPEMAETVNDPSFNFEVFPVSDVRSVSKRVYVSKTSVVDENNTDEQSVKCIIHRGGHSIADCITFRHYSLDRRKALLKKHGVCFKCCAGKHLCKDCVCNLKCDECSSTSRATAMHIFRSPNSPPTIFKGYGGENSIPKEGVTSKCTEICKGGIGKTCAKIVLVNISHISSEHPPIRVYAIIDEQSNSSLANGKVFDIFNVDTEPKPYALNSCSGKVGMSGRMAAGFIVESLDGQECIEIPSLIECDMIPDNRNEIPSSEVAMNFKHLIDIADEIPPLDEKAKILVLIGRDVMPAHYILEQRIGKSVEPIGQKLKLGWIVVGEACLDGMHVPRIVQSMKTFIKPNGRPSVMEPCSNSLITSELGVHRTLFETTKDDNKTGLSVEDKKFLQLMSEEMRRDDKSNWVAPLPFKEPRPTLPNNRQQALHRTKSFDASLHRDPMKKKHVLDFMQALLDDGHAEQAPELEPNAECWYLPLFGIYHPKKKDRIRIVFDSSAKYQGLSLNDVLMTGPNLTNSLHGVLMRFRKEKIAVIADLQQMFYSFLVRPDHRDYLRFTWHADNDFEKELVDYRMKVHVFGNSPSPAVATFGLRRTAEMAESSAGADVKLYVNNNFYVDDGLSSHATAVEAIDLLKRTQRALQEHGNLHLHKISSNSNEVLSNFKKDDLAKDLRDLDLDGDNLPMQNTLGLSWNLQLDAFTFQVNTDDKPFTRRGVLSVINGFAAPVTVTGKLLLRGSMTESVGWDEQLPPDLLASWKTWKDSLQSLKQVRVPRIYTDVDNS